MSSDNKHKAMEASVADDANHGGHCHCGCKLTGKQAAAIAKCQETVLEAVAECTREAGLSEQTVFDALGGMMDGLKHCRRTSLWIVYRAYARHPDYQLKEIQRIHPHANADSEPLDATELAEAYEKFTEAYPTTKAKEILEAYAERQAGESAETLSQRHQTFLSSFNGIARQLDKLMFQHRYHSHLIMVGGDSSVDANLGEIHTTGSGLTALAHCLNLTNDNLKGIAKVLAYASEIDSSNVANGAFKIINGRLEFDEHARSAEASIAIVHQIKTETSVGKRIGTDYSGMSGCERRAAQSVMQANRESKKNLTIAIVREALSATSKEDLGGLDIFHAGNGFGWTVIFKRLAENNVIWLGYPMGDNVRLPRAFPAEHASRAMRQPEMEGLMVAIEARAVAGQGLRFEKREYAPGAYVIYSHDYSVPSPKGAPDSPAVIQHWRTSNGVQVPCVSGDGNMWRDIYDLSFGASSSSASAPRIPIPLPMYGDDGAKPSKANPSNSKYKTAEKGKQGNEDSEDDSEEDGGYESEEEPPRKKPRRVPNRKTSKDATKAKEDGPAKVKGKGKAYEEAKPAAGPPRSSSARSASSSASALPRTRARSHQPPQEGGGRTTHTHALGPAPKPKSALKISLPDGDARHAQHPKKVGFIGPASDSDDTPLAVSVKRPSVAAASQPQVKRRRTSATEASSSSQIAGASALLPSVHLPLPLPPLVPPPQPPLIPTAAAPDFSAYLQHLSGDQAKAQLQALLGGLAQAANVGVGGGV
ncbi:hypothetical protein MVEN_02312200 [Mycena venus]|uniref:Uncharacterized protein n=1 Tax=Mycena venus TaxID=2733690 RepID=A0A8H6X4W1_9AGAR|nr:hypothetical protein MVEN_02312200 [Mycena venus]